MIMQEAYMILNESMKDIKTVLFQSSFLDEVKDANTIQIL